MDEKSEKPKGGGSAKLIVVVVIVNTLVAAGAFASTMLRQPASAPPPAAKEGEHAEKAEPAGEHGAAPAKEGEHAAAAPDGKKVDPTASRPVARVDSLVVRLRNPELDRFVRMTLDIELGKAADLGVFQSNVPRVRDAIITTLSDCTGEQLAGSVGVNKLKADLVSAIGGVLPGATVTAVYLSDFVVQ
jgi:flagellar basal body-associated protein FliL